MTDRKKPDIVFCAQAIARIDKGTFFDDYDQASADLGHLRDLLSGYADTREDAARYRWLRERDLDTISDGGVFAGVTPDNVVLNGDDLDQAVDAGMSR